MQPYRVKFLDSLVSIGQQVLIILVELRDDAVIPVVKGGSIRPRDHRP